MLDCRNVRCKPDCNVIMGEKIICAFPQSCLVKKGNALLNNICHSLLLQYYP